MDWEDSVGFFVFILLICFLGSLIDSCQMQRKKELISHAAKEFNFKDMNHSAIIQNLNL